MSERPQTPSEHSGVERRRLLQVAAAALAAPLWPFRAEAEGAGAMAVLRGRVRYPGKATRPGPVTLSGDCAYCRRFDLRREDLRVSADGGLRDVAVVLDGAPAGAATPGEVVLAEHRCTFVPHVLTVTAGSTLLMLNRDPVLNTFHAVEQEGGRTLFNIGLPSEGMKVRRRLRAPGLVKMLCDVHPWEVAYLVCVSHPFHAVTDARGRFALPPVPPGRYKLRLWHESLGRLEREVTLTAGQELDLALTLGKQR